MMMKRAGKGDSQRHMLNTSSALSASSQVMFKTPVSITEHPKINEWLTLVEKEMRVTLAKLLAESVTEIEIFGKSTDIDPATYISWIDKYQVTLPPGSSEVQILFSFFLVPFLVIIFFLP